MKRIKFFLHQVTGFFADNFTDTRILTGFHHAGRLVVKMFDRPFKSLSMDAQMKDHPTEFYERVAEEMRTGQMRQGLMAKAFSNALGDEKKARALYIQFRVEEMALLADEESKAAKKAQKAEAERQTRERDAEEEKKLWKNLDGELAGNRPIVAIAFAGAIVIVIWAILH